MRRRRRSRPVLPRPRSATCSLAVVLAASLAAFAPGAVAGGSYASREPLPAARSEAGAAVVDGRLVVCGGLVPSPFLTVTERCSAYDPATDTWDESVPDLPRAFDHVRLAELEGRLFCVGGGNLFGGTVTDRVYVLEPGAAAWREIAPMPTARWGAWASGWNGRVYVTGGLGRPGEDVRPVLELEPPDPSVPSDIGVWRELEAALPWSVNHHAGAVVDGTLLVLTGRDASNVNVPQTWAFDLTEDPVAGPFERAPACTARSGVGAAVLRGRVHVLGGEDVPTGDVFDEHEVYDPVLDTWVVETPLPRPTHGPVAGVVDGEIFLAGGIVEGLGTSAFNERFAPFDGACPPVVTLEAAGPREGCEAEVVRLDASASAWAACEPDLRRLSWEDAGGRVLGSGPVLDLELSEGSQEVRLFGWCGSDPACATSSASDCVEGLSLVLEGRTPLEVVVDGPAEACTGQVVSLDAGGSSSVDCEAADLAFEWRDAEGGLLGEGALVDVPLETGVQVVTVTAWCRASPGCSAALDVELTGLFDELPPPLGAVLGPLLRMTRLGADLRASWGPFDHPWGGFELVRREHADGPPRPAAMDSAAVVGVADPVETAIDLPSAAGDGEALSHFQLRALSPCSLTPGPTCDGFPAQGTCP